MTKYTPDEYARVFDNIDYEGFEIYDTKEDATPIVQKLIDAGIPAKVTKGKFGSAKYGTRLKGFMVWIPATHPSIFSRNKKFIYTSEQITQLDKILKG